MVCLILGDTNADLSAALEYFPREGDDVALQSLAFHCGGTGANVAVAQARLGGRSRLLTRVGRDPTADVALRAALEAGVDLSFVQHDAFLTTGLCFAAISPSGERTFFSHRGANAALEMPPLDEVFQDAHWLHFSGHALLEGQQRSTALMLLDEAHRRTISTSLDLCLPLLRRRAGEIETLARRLSVIFANEQELHLLGTSLGLTETKADPVETALSFLTKAGAPVVVAKLGAAGSRIAQGSSRTDIPPMLVTAVNTTGAGDGFVAAFLYARQHRATPDVAAQIGNVVGALIASRNGAAEASPHRDEVCAVLAAASMTAALDVFARQEQETTL